MRQRAMIAMALVNEPKVLIADEPTTALDVTIQAQILRLLERLQKELGMAVILITHDLGVVAEVADYVNVMYAGRIVETGTLDQIFYDPQHPYTWGLLGSIARPDRPRVERLSQISGQPPSLLAPPRGCHFRPRCPHAFEQCGQRLRPLEVRGGEPGHQDRCWLSPEQKKGLRVVGEGQYRPGGAGRMTGVAAGPQPAEAPQRRWRPARGHRPRQALSDQARGSSSNARSAGCGRWTGSASPSRRARRWAWSASRAAASRRSAARSFSCSSRPPARCDSRASEMVGAAAPARCGRSAGRCR